MKNIAKTVADNKQDSDNITKTSVKTAVECYSGDPNRKSFRIKMESGHWKIRYEGFGCNKSTEKTAVETEKGTAIKTVESTEETAIQTEKYTENSKNITKTVVKTVEATEETAIQTENAKNITKSVNHFLRK